MNIKEIMEYCRTHNCNAFAINEKNYEIFELSYTQDNPDVEEFNVFYSH